MATTGEVEGEGEIAEPEALAEAEPVMEISDSDSDSVEVRTRRVPTATEIRTPRLMGTWVRRGGRQEGDATRDSGLFLKLKGAPHRSHGVWKVCVCVILIHSVFLFVREGAMKL